MLWFVLMPECQVLKYSIIQRSFIVINEFLTNNVSSQLVNFVNFSGISSLEIRGVLRETRQLFFKYLIKFFFFLIHYCFQIQITPS